MVEVNTNHRDGPGCITFDDEGAAARRDSLRRVAEEHGMPEPLESIHDGGPARARFAREFRAHPEVDCVVLHDAWAATGAYIAAATVGRRIPQDLGIAAFGSLWRAWGVDLGLTIASIDEKALGEMAARRLLMQIDGDETAREPVRVSYQLHVHGSTA